LFIAAKDDDFIAPHHTDELYSKYSGDKKKMLVEGDHNSQRGLEVMDEISRFFYFGLQVKELVVAEPEYIEKMKNKKGENKKKEREEEEDKGKGKGKEKLSGNEKD
jgi:hypothetical protein